MKITLRKKTIIVTGLTFFLMTALIFWMARVILLESFRHLENQQMHIQLSRAVEGLAQEGESLRSTGLDWAHWDDTYRFVQDINPEYVDLNFGEGTLGNLRLDFMLFFDSSGRLVYQKASTEDDDRNRKLTVLVGHLAARNDLVRHQGATGVILTSGGPVYIAVTPILTSKKKGPVRGSLIVGRFLDPAAVQALGEKVKLRVRIYRLGSPRLPAPLRDARQERSPHPQPTIHYQDESTITIFKQITDISGKPVLMIGITDERGIYQQGLTSVAYFLYAFALVGLVFIVATLAFLEVSILSRLSGLSRVVRRIGRKGDMAVRLPVRGRDELGSLAVDINAMLETLRVSTERDMAILENIEDLYFEIDLRGHLILCNHAVTRLLGRKKEDLLGKRYDEFLDEPTALKAFDAITEVYRSGRPVRGLEVQVVRSLSENLYLDTVISVIRNAEGDIVAFRGIARDVTERKESEAQLTRMVYRDSLTGLYNRKACLEYLDQELAVARRYSQERSVLYLDLDRFKDVNDTFGHEAGDNMLIEVGRRIVSILRDSDRVCRMGGDEFAIILANPGKGDPWTVSRRIDESLSEPYVLGDITVDFVRSSIGIGIFPDDGDSVGALLRYADKEMYKCKLQRKEQ